MIIVVFPSLSLPIHKVISRYKYRWICQNKVNDYACLKSHPRGVRPKMAHAIVDDALFQSTHPQGVRL